MSTYAFNLQGHKPTDTPDGLEVRFNCCRAVARFSRAGRPEEIGREIQQHVCVKTSAYDGNPEAATMADLVTPKQLVAIRAIANSQGLKAERECIKCFQCVIRPEELSRRAASFLIDHLKAYERAASSVA